MNFLGVHLSVLMSEAGPPRPVPIVLAQALKDVQVTHNDQGASGFQITFQIGRSGPWDLVDFALLRHPLLKPFNRVMLLIRFAIVPEVLMDGIITNIQMRPSEEPGASTLTVTGEDVSVMMDLEQQDEAYPAHSDYMIVQNILANYTAAYGVTLSPPPADPAPMIPANPIEDMRHRPANMTDRAYLQELAQYHGYVFYLTPGPAPLINTAHWGPPERLSIPQPALSVNMGPASNVSSIQFSYNALQATKVSYEDDEHATNTIESPNFSRMIPLVRSRATARKLTKLSGVRGQEASDQAQGKVNSSFDSVVTASGELDTLRYERLLQPRSLVGLRGAGDTYDGLYYVQNVTHSISKGRYTQNFTLTREGTGTLTPLVRI